VKWFRANTRHGARLALFALLVQFALSFGHFHGVSAQTVQIGRSDAGLTSPTDQDAAGEVARQQQPADHDTDRHTAHACVICSVISLANNFLFTTSPVLDLPETIELLHLTTVAEFAHLGWHHPPFRSRAPPAS